MEFVSKECDHFPSLLLEYLESCEKRGSFNNELYIASKSNDWKEIADGINRLFLRACEITNQNPNQVLKNCDLGKNDTQRGRISSAFAEVRTINWLSERGFTRIRQLRSSLSRKADIVAQFNEKSFAVEVFNRARWNDLISTPSKMQSVSKAKYSNETSEFEPEDLFLRTITREGLGEFYADRVKDKLPQVGTTLRSQNLHYSLFVLVVDAADAVAFSTEEDWNSCVQSVYDEIGEKECYYGLFTGQKNYLTGQDDSAIYPPLFESS